MKKTMFSGVQPSGVPSLGNYLGAFKQFPKFVQSHDTFVCVVDLHALSVRQNPEELRYNTLSLVAWYMASGLDPKECTLFVQSHVPAHSQLNWILSTLTYMGELERMTQYKDKSAKKAENLNAGLFTYPVLMAADILLYGTHVVPVGDDQKQHLELARDVAQRFNAAFGKTFNVPEMIAPPAGARVKDLQEPTRKMSKSEPGPGTILLTEPVADVVKKIKRAVTDNEARIAYDVALQPGVANLLEILGACTDKDPKHLAMEMDGLQYGALKGAVADAVAETLGPLQERHAALLADKGALLKVLETGAERANAVANATLAKVHERMGLVAPR